jgi:hypothetical protein
MKHAAEAKAVNPFDVRALWGMDEAVGAYGGDAYKVWFDGMTRMQAEAGAFWTQRLQKDVAALTMLGQCRDPAQAMDAQMRFAREAMADYVAGGERMMLLFRAAATPQ